MKPVIKMLSIAAGKAAALYKHNPSPKERKIFSNVILLFFAESLGFEDLKRQIKLYDLVNDNEFSLPNFYILDPNGIVFIGDTNIFEKGNDRFLFKTDCKI